LRQKATAARPSANSPALTVVANVSPTTAAALTVQGLGQQLRDLLPPRRLHSVSVCDHDANVMWLSEGALGPDENSVIVEALDALAGDTSLHCHEISLEDGRHALFLAVRSPHAQLVGTVMILADSKSVGDDTQERVTAAPVRALVQRLAVLMKPAENRQREPVVVPDGDPSLLLELLPDPDIAPAPPPRPAAVAATRAAPKPAGKAAPAPRPAPAAPDPAAPARLSDRQVNDMLEFDAAPPARAASAPRVNGGPSRPTHETSAEMVRLEFLLDEPGSAPPVASAPKPAPSAPRVPQPAPLPAAALIPTLAAAAPAAPAAPAAEPAPAAAVPAAVVPAAVVPAVSAAPASDATLILEVQQLAKLRAGGQTRRFQVLPRASVAPRDPAALDALVLQRLLAWLAAHRSAWNSQPTSFTVSLSIATLEDERFAQKIAAALNAHGIAAETLGFEIAEAICTQRRAQVERFINQCEKTGSWVVIEDFSFDSQVLPLLRSKAVRLVKINQKLSASALKDKLSQALVVATVQAAKVMGIHCAAKKVDSQAALQWLTAIGFDFAQGTVLSPPQPLEALAGSPDPTVTSAALRPG
jgi:EAL domain-containing protein (putative c-di-GMP-specific phosphodiesterase class I)